MRPGLLGRGVVFLGLVKQEVGSQLLVLVTCKVGLDSLVAWEAKTAELSSLSAPLLSVTNHVTYTLDGISFFFGDGNRLGTRRERGVIVNIFAEQVQELARVVGNQLGKLGVALTELLQDGLQHLGLLLYHLSELLELSIIPKEVQISKPRLLATRSRSTWVASPSGTALLCGSEIEKIDIAFTTSLAARSRLRRCNLAGRGGVSGGSLGCGLVLLLDVIGDALQVITSARQSLSSAMVIQISVAGPYRKKILDGAVGVVVCCTHGCLCLGLLETHCHHLLNRCASLVAHRQGRRVVESLARWRCGWWGFGRRRSSWRRGRRRCGWASGGWRCSSGGCRG